MYTERPQDNHFLGTVHLYFDTVSFTSLELAKYTKLVDLSDPKMYLSLPPECQDYKQMALDSFSFLNMDVRIRIQVLIL